jgi:hypothetical protein
MKGYEKYYVSKNKKERKVLSESSFRMRESCYSFFAFERNVELTDTDRIWSCTAYVGKDLLLNSKVPLLS